MRMSARVGEERADQTSTDLAIEWLAVAKRQHEEEAGNSEEVCRDEVSQCREENDDGGRASELCDHYITCASV